MNRRLQGAMVPLVPAASETITAPQPEQSLPPLPDVRLLGTARDSDSPQSTAWLKTPTDTVILAQEGETIAKIPGAPVLKSVDIGRVVLLFGDREMVLEMKAIIRER